MKKAVFVCMIMFLVLSLAGCSRKEETPRQGVPAAESDAGSSSGEQQEAESDAGSSSGEQQKADESASEDGGSASRILIAYFSYGENTELPEGIDASSSASIQPFDGEITGNTGLIAHYIKNATGGELFSIQTAEKYASDYDTVLEQGKAEKDNHVKPEIATHIENLDDYDTIFIGFPNWWYGMPMVMYSFLDEYDFSGKTIVPFCTSGGSAFSNAVEEIREAEPDAEIMDGLHIGASSAQDAENDVTEWITELDL
ncbi:MAG: flavodoxin [Lachnospiraceae bacterium]|nr:flavodoxin [Lachnospiraceae bacterium]